MRALYGIRTYLNTFIGQYRNNSKKVSQNYIFRLSVRKYPAVAMNCVERISLKMKSRDHKLNALVPNGRSVPYVLRLCNKLPSPRANTKRYKNSLIPWCLEHFQLG